ncbi:MAG: hypothetical protein GTO54_09680 [Nitrososphaeria archaeon]|nr:hypothetical protein [Nitrososphaeria archaeon]
MIGKDRLLEKTNEAADFLAEFQGRRIAVLTHYDADGLAAGGALIRYCSHSNSPFICRSVSSPTERELQEFRKIRADLYVFLDMGTGQINLIKGLWNEEDHLLIIDHHQSHVNTPLENEGTIILNPELFGLDGGRDGCSSILASLTAYQAMDEKDDYMLKLGVIGAVGDMQGDGGENSFNHLIFQKALEKGVVKSFKDFTFFRLRNAPIHKAIAWTYVPYIPGLSGRDDKAISLLTSANISLKKHERWRRVKELSDEERPRIVEEVVKYIATLGVEVKSQDLIHVVYEFLDEDEWLYDANEFSHALSSCGRMDRTDLGLILAAGTRGKTVVDVKEVTAEKRRMVAKQMESIKEKLTLTENVLLVDGRGVIGERFTGTFSTFFSMSPLYEDKVVLLFCNAPDGTIRLSGRTPRHLVDRGFNLGEILAEEASKEGGVGGGHNVAAGATLPLEQGDTILERIVDRIGVEVEKVVGEGRGPIQDDR